MKLVILGSDERQVFTEIQCVSFYAINTSMTCYPRHEEHVATLDKCTVVVFYKNGTRHNVIHNLDVILHIGDDVLTILKYYSIWPS